MLPKLYIWCSQIALQLNVVASYVVSKFGLQGPRKSGRSWDWLNAFIPSGLLRLNVL
jgi:hypothetical protein